MINLCVSTSTDIFGFILIDQYSEILSNVILRENSYSDISVLFSECLNKAHISVQDISRIMVDVGPGGTSRTRTGISFANALSYSLNIPLLPVSAFELIGKATWKEHQTKAIIIVKSIKDNAFIGLYEDRILISIQFGKPLDIITSFNVYGNLFSIVGYNREHIIRNIDNFDFIDAGDLKMDLRIFQDILKHLPRREYIFPNFAKQITEINLEL